MASIAVSISLASRTAIDETRTLSDGAEASIARNLVRFATLFALSRTKTRVVAGAISLSNSNHFPLMDGSGFINPVALPPVVARASSTARPAGRPASRA
jgi:hypothetical protein